MKNAKKEENKMKCIRRILILAAAVTGLFSSVASASIINVYATEDAMVASGSSTSNFGAQANFTTSATRAGTRAPFYYSYEWTYLKFDLSSIPVNQGITGVTLNLAAIGGNNYTDGVTGTQAYFVASDNWTESTIRWNIRPTYGAAIGSNGSGAAGSWTTPIWQAWTLALTPEMLADGVLSIALVETNFNQSHDFAAREWAGIAYDPYLSVMYTPAAAPVPIPAAAWLLGTGLIGLTAIRRKFK